MTHVDTPERLLPPLPEDEFERLQSLAAYDLVDTLPEQEYDDLALLAAALCGTPVALVTVLDIGTQYFKASVGAPVDRTRRQDSFCAWAVLDPQEPLVVPDAHADERFRGSPLVEELGLRFYAGVPLLSREDQPLGTLCVLDTRPRELTEDQLGALRALARQATAHLELRRALTELSRQPLPV